MPETSVPDRSWKKDALVEYAKANNIEIDESANNFAILSVITKHLGIKLAPVARAGKRGKKPVELTYFDFSSTRVFFEFEMKGENRDELKQASAEKIKRIADKFNAKMEDLQVQNIFASDQLMRVSVEMKPNAMILKLRKVIELC